MKIGDCVVVTEGMSWTVGRVVQENGTTYEVESAMWPEWRRWVEGRNVRPLEWLLRMGQAVRVLALTSRWASADDVGERAFYTALQIVIGLGLGMGPEGLENE